MNSILFRLVISVALAESVVMLAYEYIHPLNVFAAKYPFLGSVLDVLILTVVITLIYLRIFKKPLDEFVHVAVTMGRGDLSQRANEKIRGELGTLARAFNETADKLQNNSIDLEKQVVERTEKLSRTQRATLNILEDLHTSKLALEKSRESFVNIVVKSVDGILVVCRDGSIRFASPSAAQMLGTEIEKMVGTDFGLQIREGQVSDIRIVRADGEVGVGEIRSTPTQWEGRDSYLIIVRDVTERKKIEEALVVANVRLKKTDQLKSDFVSAVSHELRTPLAIIGEGVGIVLDGVVGTINPEQSELLTVTKGNVDRLTNIINDLLDMSKIEAGKVVIRRTLIDLSDLLKEVCGNWNLTVVKKGQSCELVVSDPGVDIYVDGEKITQVVNNLISNALKYTRNGKVIVKLENRKEAVDVSVSNIGEGIAAADLPLVFGKFQQFNRPVGAGAKGTGLGLAICKSLAELHGGTIKVESEPDKVTQFTFTLPKLSAEEVAKEYISIGIKQAAEKKSYFSLLAVDLSGFDAISATMGTQEARNLLKECENEIRNSMSREVDILRKDMGALLVFLSDANRTAADVEKNRIEGVLNAYLSKSQIESLKKLKVIAKFATYPEDGQDVDELLMRLKLGGSC